MHTRQGVANPALLQNSASFSSPSDNYEQDALRRAALHDELWQGEPLTSWQRFMLEWEVRR